jgi:hypothetical protein
LVADSIEQAKKEFSNFAIKKINTSKLEQYGRLQHLVILSVLTLVRTYLRMHNKIKRGKVNEYSF